VGDTKLIAGTMKWKNFRKRLVKCQTYIRLVVGLHLLKHIEGLSDEAV
jgi:hypothetical protein